MTETLVIYHGDCSDGFTAAWAFRKLGPEGEAAFYVPAKHGDPPPDVRGKDVYILDFAYPRETLLRMQESARSLLVLDHHKTAEADLVGLPFCVFDMERSGAGLTWDHLSAIGHLPSERPWLINIIEDRDLWRYRFGDETRFASAYITTLPMTFETWDALASARPDQLVEKGEAIESYIDDYGEKACKQAVFRELGGYTVPVINIPYMNASDHIDRLCRVYPSYPFGASFFLGGDGRWQFSLRSIGDFDVSEIALKYGGGGHKNAAGFKVEKLPWGQAG
jgi:oligoribonuclease NrnB/cAMP/cGMP phosphodiesterase (DHH superfamily)